jgi:hypothetical protein
MTRFNPAWCLSVAFGIAAFTPGAALTCSAGGENGRFDATDCLTPRADPAAPLEGSLLQNRCDSAIAMLVVVCDLATQPACKVDPVYSKGWRTRRGVEYLAPARTSVDSRETYRSLLPSYAPGVQRGWRAQIAACKLNTGSVRSQDPCILRLARLKRSLDASAGQSIRAALREMRRHCSI